MKVLGGVTQGDCDLLADVIWFIRGRQSALLDRNAPCELNSEHIEALRKFRVAFLLTQKGAKDD